MVAKWIRLDWSQRLALLEAASTLTISNIAVHLLPFRWISPRLGILGKAPTDRQINKEQQKEAQQIGWAIMVLARYFPWDAKCLARALAGKWMLQRRGITSTLYLGVEQVQGGEKWLDAHAWLRCESVFVTGESQHESYKVLATFTEDWL
jgi:hypothetical protein